MNDTYAILVIIALAVLGLFVIPRFFLKRAIRRVIRIFRDNGALNAKSAKSIDELKLRPRSFLEVLLKGRDYKPYAVDILRRAEIIQMTGDGRVFLSEEKLALSRLAER